MTALKIRQKLALLVTVPLVAVIVFATLAVITTGGEALQADRLHAMVKTNQAVGKLTYALQQERSVAVRTLFDKGSDKAAEKFDDQASDTDDLVTKYQQARDELGSIPSTTESLLKQIDKGLERLDTTREQVGTWKQSATSTAFAYRIAIADLLTFRESVPQATGASSDVADQIRASNQLARAIEYHSVTDAAVVRAVESGDLSYKHQREITEANTGMTEALLGYDQVAPSEWKTMLEGSQEGDLESYGVLEDEVLRTPAGKKVDIELDDWTTTVNDYAENLYEVQKDIDGQIAESVTTTRDGQYLWAAAQIGGVLIAVLLAVLLAMSLGTPVVRGLRRLRSSAHRVATQDLPRAVTQLEDHSTLGERTPEQFAKEATPPVQIKGEDELADVGRAFNEVHQEAIRVAAEQALLRLNIGEMFVRLARRGHSLSGRLTSVLDEAERNEQDPERLERLFALDHLVALFGRSNDSLLVLGGASPAKPRTAKETAANVLTAAQGQIEQYQRVEVGVVDEAMIDASAVDDSVKLLAELLDNATRFSDLSVTLSARMLSDRMIIEVSDKGIGIPPPRMEQLNARLAGRSPIDLEALQAMGLTVVGHLAHGHGIKVELRQSGQAGVIAEVTIPGELLERIEPKALPSTPGPAGEVTQNSNANRRRNAPLFSRTRRTRKTPEEPQQQQYSPAQSQPQAGRPGDRQLGSRGQMVPQQPGEVNRELSNADTQGMPVLRFDWGTNQDEPDSQSEVIEASQPRERPRRMAFREEPTQGWKAAAASWEAAEQPSTGDGLPKREPMAQLVPGAVEAAEAADRPAHAMASMRNPNTVGATYSAYVKARGGKRRPQPPNPPRNTQ